MKLATLAVFGILAAGSLGAQTGSGKPQGATSQPHQTDSALTAETRRAFQAIELNILKAARDMPEKSYTFTPIDGVRTLWDAGRPYCQHANNALQ